MHRKRISRLHCSILHISMCHQKWDFYGGPTFRKYTPQKIAAPSRKFLDENPMKGDGMSMAWMSFNLPNFFRGTPSPKPPFAPKKETESKKKTLNNPSNPHWVCLLQLPPPKKNHPLRTEKTGWASPRYFPPAGPEIRWDRCVPGNDVAPPVASKEPRRWRPTGLVLEQSNSIQKMTVFFWGQKLKM